MAKKKLRTLWDNRFFDAATLTPSSQVAGLPAVNLQDQFRQRVWRTTGLANQSLRIDLGTPSDINDVRPPVQALVLINHNFTMAAQVRIQLGTIDETHDVWSPIVGAGEGRAGLIGAGGLITPAQLPWYAPQPLSIIYLDGDPVEAKGVATLTLSDPGNPAGYLEIGRIFLTYFDEYLYDWAWPWELGAQDDSTTVYSPGGQPWTDRRPPRRLLHFLWNKRLSDVDKYWTLFFMLSKVGCSRDWVIDPLPEGVSSRFFTALYGRFDASASGGSGSGNLPTLSQQFSGFSDFELNFVESL